MKATELRIGNYNLFNGKLDRINDGYDIDHVKNEDGHEPVLLTEEWLLRLGFKLEEHKNGNIFRIKTSTKSDRYKGFLELVNKNSIESPMFFISLNSDCGKYFPFTSDIDYVHQLQNLYFALTDKELEI